MKLTRRFSLVDVEIGGCFAFWTGCVFYSLYRLNLAGKVLENVDDAYQDFSKGWSFIGRRKDVGDFEWQLFKHIFLTSVPWFFVSLVLSEFLRTLNYVCYLPHFQVAIAILNVWFHFNVKVVAIMLCQPVVFEIVGKFNRKLYVWGCCVAFMTAAQCYKQIYWEYVGLNEAQHVQTVFAIAWINLRCCSCYAQQVDDKMSNSFVSILAYCLYLPVLYVGPFMSYKDFEKSQQKSTIRLHVRLKRLLQDITRFLFWIVVTELFLHYIYVNAFSYQLKLVDNFNTWTRCGFGYAMGQFFHLKYVVAYGISTSLARFENVPVPNIPKCIGRIHLYSDMWKYFDRGLYEFLLRQIYIPTLKVSKPYTSVKAQATFLCFLFVYVWHGLQWYIFVWSVLNYLGVSLEALFGYVYKCYWKASFDQSINSSCKRRISCILATPLLTMSAISNFYFFGGIQIGNVFFKHLFLDDFRNTFVLLAALYCCCQVSVQVKQWEIKRAKQK